jgi:hypothetical protein
MSEESITNTIQSLNKPLSHVINSSSYKVYIGEYDNTTKKFHILEYETRDLTNLGDKPAKYDIDFTTIVPRDNTNVSS